jgi:cardiolipin synthase
MIRKIIGILFIFLHAPLFAQLPSDWPEHKILILPEMENKHILSVIKSAKKSIDLTLYRLEDTQVIDQLIEAKKRGVNVRLILQKPCLYPSPFDNINNGKTIAKLKEIGILTHFLPDHNYSLTHYKFIIIDGEYAIVQTFNYDDFNFKTARNFGLTVENKTQVEALKKIFDNDYKGNYSKNDEAILSLWKNAKLVLGPIHQREIISEFLRSAKHSVYIYQQDISDPEIGKILASLAKEGKRVEVLMTPLPFGGIDNNRINQTIITANGGEFHFKPKSELYIHAKVILIDPEKDGQMYIGSCNLWPEALSRNRELGIVTTDKSQIQAVYDTFKKDWQSSYSYQEAEARTLKKN